MATDIHAARSVTGPEPYVSDAGTPFSSPECTWRIP